MAKGKINVLAILAMLLTIVRWARLHGTMASNLMGGLCIASTVTVVGTSAVLDTTKAEQHFAKLSYVATPTVSNIIPLAPCKNDTVIKESIKYETKLVRALLDTTITTGNDTFRLFTHNGSLSIGYKIYSGVIADSNYVVDIHTNSLLVPFRYTNEHIIDLNDSIIKIKYRTLESGQFNHIRTR